MGSPRMRAGSLQSLACSFFPLGHELGPAREAFALQVLMEQVVAGSVRLCRRAPQVHVGFLGRPSALAVVAGPTGADQVVPAVPAAAVPRRYVIQRQVPRPHPTVLTRMVVADEDLASREPHPRPRPLDHIDQPNDRRPWKKPTRRSDRALGVLETLWLAAFPPNH